MGSPYILPPGTPPEQLRILRQAFTKTFNDPEFHKEYKKMVGEEPTPIHPEEMDKLIKDLQRDVEIIDLFKKINAAGVEQAARLIGIAHAVHPGAESAGFFGALVDPKACAPPLWGSSAYR